MKPPVFDYRCADSVEEAIELLARHRGDAKLIAGGQSLIPMLNFRVVRPGLLVDIGKLVELDYLREGPQGALSIGALTRHRTLETSPQVERLYPVIPEAMRHVAHLAIRNRGTIGGSLSHADPAAELPMLTRLLDATIVARSTRGERQIPAQDFFVGALSTALEEDELVVRIDLPPLAAGTGWAFEEFSRRAGDFALAAVGALIEVDHGVVRRARVAMMGVGDTPMRCPGAEHALAGRSLDNETLEVATAAACAPLEPNKDLHASSEYRKHLAAVLCRRVLRQAAERTKEIA
jgi:carbon-monoxide dehydrogenase medium subunit